MDLQLTGKRALVTGSTAGIGHAIAARLVREGAQVVINGRHQAGVDEALARLRAELAVSAGGGAVTGVAAETTSGAPGAPGSQETRPGTTGAVEGFAGDLSRADVAEALVRRHPGIDILVNNLGIFEAKPFEAIGDDDWRHFFEVNVLSGVRLARLCLPHMRGQDWGRIIFISSESAVQIPAEMVHYGVTKTAQLAVSRGLAETLAGTGITVNCVLPGPTRSRGVGDFVEQLARSEGKRFEDFEREFFVKARPTSLIKRFLAPDEIAPLVAYLASPLASATTGAALRADGGVVKSAF